MRRATAVNKFLFKAGGRADVSQLSVPENPNVASTLQPLVDCLRTF